MPEYRTAENLRIDDCWIEDRKLVRLVGVQRHTIGSMVLLDVVDEAGNLRTLNLYRVNTRRLETPTVVEK